MSAARQISLAFSIAAGICALAAPCLAQTRTEIETASSAPMLDLSSRPTEAINAAKAAQTTQPRAAAGDTLEPVTVHPESQPQGRVVASTDAASLTSPNYSAKDNQDPIMAVSLGKNTALGMQTFDNSQPEGFLKVNPQTDGVRSTFGLTTLISTR